MAPNTYSSTRIYFSNSFHDEDKVVVNAIRAVFDELRERIPFEDVSTALGTGEQLFNRLVRPMTDVDIVVCIFTRRHEVAGQNRPTFTAPAYVVSEAAAALVQRKQVLVFVEKGIQRAELGFIDAYNPQWKDVDRDRCGTLAYHRELVKNVEASLQALVKDRPPSYTYEMYESHVALYPNEYVMVTQRIDVRMVKVEDIKHELQLFPEGEVDQELPSASELYRVGRENPAPYPTTPFSAFSSSSPQAKFIPNDKASRGLVREYKVKLGSPGLHHYEWSWGTPHGFKRTRLRDWYLLEISQREVERVRIVFRVHRAVTDREREVRWARVTPGLLADGDPDDVQMRRLDGESEAMDLSRENPFFQVHELTINRIRRGQDLLVLF